VTAPPPDRLGPYQVVALLGAGGMGRVYRGRDPRLKRDVAIKVLARAGADPAQQRRFTEEAQAASALNHPNILSVYDVGTHDGTPYIVSELVEGTSLREMLARGPLAIRQVLELGVQMADGLAAAHHAGIVHRDFKPENVMVTRDGRVKILDFGLAVIGIRDGEPVPSADITLTATGVIVGTVPYMSPEQARGAAVDYRTDQFSLGLTLYEMLTGRRAFAAETAAQILAAILDDEPESIAKLNPRVGAPVRWVIERCLAKDPRQRYESTADLARELRTLRDHLPEFTPPSEIAPTSVRRRRVGALMVIATSMAIAALGTFAALSGGSDANLDRYRFTPIATDAGYQGTPAWSPDGKTLAYVAEKDGVLQVFTRSLGSSMRQQVTHSLFDCRDPFWSPDGTRLYYTALARDRNGLWSITAAGGEPELVLENVGRAALSPDGKTLALFRAVEGEKERSVMHTLWFSSPPGSQPVQYTRPPFGVRRGYSDSTGLHFSPDGSKLGVWVVPWWEDAPRWEPEFWIIPMSDAAPRLVGPVAPDLPTVAAPFSWLPDSRSIVSAIGYPSPGIHLWLTDTERPSSRLLTMTGGVENDPAVSPDGRRMALSLQQADYDLYQLSIEHPAPSVLLATSRSETDPAWSPLGDQMAFTTDRTGHEETWLRSQTGDFDRPLVTPQDFGGARSPLLSAAAFSPDGQRIAYYRLGPEGQRIWITPVAGGPPVQLAPGEHSQDSPTWSPDGAWIAYVHGRQGDWALAKSRFGARAAPVELARDILPLSPVKWSPDGAWIGYNARDGLALVSPDGTSTRLVQGQPWLTFAWSTDSRRLFGIRQSDDLRHLTFTSIDINSKTERVLGADFMPLPMSNMPVRGFARISPTMFVTSIAHIRSDVWLLDGFQTSFTLWDRLTNLVRGAR